MTNPTLKQEADAIAAIAAKITKGGWGRNIRPASRYPTIFAGRNTHIAVMKTTGLPEEELEANTDLIQAAPGMADLIARQQAKIDQLQAAISPLRGYFRSGNGTPIERATIRASDWAPVEIALSSDALAGEA